MAPCPSNDSATSAAEPSQFCINAGMPRTRRTLMRRTPLFVILAVTVVLGALSPVVAQQPKAQQQDQQPKGAGPPPAQQGGPAAPKPYKPVAVELPKPVTEPSFVAFRKQLAGMVQKKDRATLARSIAQSFFWIPEDKDIADSKKPPIDNPAKAIGLD